MKFCIRCKLAIDMDNERYVRVSDFDKKKNIKDLYFHKECWHEFCTLKNMQTKELSKAGKIMNFAAKKLGFEDKEEEEVLVY